MSSSATDTSANGPTQPANFAGITPDTLGMLSQCAQRIEQVGRALLIQADCRDVLPLLPKVSHVITDPPYGAGTHEQHDARSERRRDGANAKALGYSALSERDVIHFAKAFDELSLGWVVWFTNFDLSPVVKDALSETGRVTFPALPYFHSGRSVRLAGDGPCSWTDWILVARTKAIRTWGTLRGGYIAGQGWDDKERMGGKPTRLMRLVVSDYSRAGELVCDPFMGAGTTGVACILEDRDFIGIEIDGPTFDIACRRISEAQRQGDLFISAA